MIDKDTIARYMFSAADETFATMLGLQIVPGKPSAENPDTATDSERVVALIGLAGPYSGTGIISCSPALACKLSSTMLMSDLNTINGEVLDAVGELSNMVFGNVKTMLERQVGQLGLSIPTVVYGRNFWTRSVGEQWIAVPVEVDGCDLDLRMCISQNHSGLKYASVRQHVPVTA